MTARTTGMEISAARVTRGALGPRLEAEIRVDGISRVIYYETTAADVSRTMDAFLAGALLPAMKVGGPLVIRGPVSPELLARTDEIQRIVEIWRDDPRCPDVTRTRFRPVEVIVEGAEADTQGYGRATFFSGGIDSFDTVLTAVPDLAALLFIDDFEMTFEDDLRTALYDNVRAVADEFSLEAVRIRTNCRPVFADMIGRLMHTGSELCSVALAHAPWFSEVIIPSSDDLRSLHPLGTHPLIDDLYSTSRLRIRHDTIERTRMDKVSAVAASDFALAHLRVCWEPSFNCGHCSKCVRTLWALKAVGRDGAATSFARRDITPEQVVGEALRFRAGAFFFSDIADYCDIHGIMPEYVAALRAATATPPAEPVSREEAVLALTPMPVRRLGRRVRAWRGGGRAQ